MVKLYSLLSLALFSIVLIAIVESRNDYEHHFCSSEPFCNRNMYWETQAPIYFIDDTSFIQSDNIITLRMKNLNSGYIKNTHELLLYLYILKNGIFRIKIKEDKSNRFEMNESDLPFEIKQQAKLDGNAKIVNSKDELIIYYFEDEPREKKTKYELNIKYNPFSIVYKMANKNIFEMNNKNLFDMEFPSNENEINEVDAMSAIKMDIRMSQSFLLTGLPERNADVALGDTNQRELYHFYNVDMFKYTHRPFFGLYGFLPFIMSHSHGADVVSGFIWNNPSETFVAIKTLDEGKDILWISETGIFDFSFWADGSIENFYQKYSQYIGQTPLPPIHSLGYHQSRFSYKSLKDVQKVDDSFDKYNIPYDTIWFDIDHTDEKRYFTWNSNFQGIEEFFNEQEKKGRQVVLIIDPHIKIDKWYFVYWEAHKQNFFIKHEGKDFVGNCWSKESSYLDFYNEDVRNYWKNLILETDSYFTKSQIINIWIDMNEPSVFEIDRYTIPKMASISYDKNNYQHRVAHNIYGYLMQKTTYETLILKYKRRPFLLTRSFFLGSHKYGTMWTGDPMSSFEDLQHSVPMLLSLSLSGYSFIGADAGGFAENSSAPVYSRWYLLATFYPFFRSHSHSHTYRREPWLFDQATYEIIKSSIITRYQIMPYIYTEFYQHHMSGMPILCPIWFKYQNELTLDRYSNLEFFFGSSLLIRPVLKQEEDLRNSIQTYLPEEDRWYDFYTYDEIIQKGELLYHITPKTIGVFIKGGKIFPLKMRLRRSTKMMKHDPLTLVIALDTNQKSSGLIYFDDENSFDYYSGKQRLVTVNYVSGHISLTNTIDSYDIKNYIEKIIVLGLDTISSLTSVLLVNNNKKTPIEYTVIKNYVELKRLHLDFKPNWDLQLQFN